MADQRPTQELYSLVSAKADAIEAELRRLGSWDDHPLPPEKFKDMGAFGSHTMGFEQWIQFVLIPRIKSIIQEKDVFPDNSNLAPYAIRYFDGYPDAGVLHQLLYDLDGLINGAQDEDPKLSDSSDEPDTIYLGDPSIPQIVYTLVGVLHEFEGDPLESQLQTYDTFLSVLAPSARPEICRLLLSAAGKAINPVSKQRIEKAAASIAGGGRAAELYNHEEAIRKYQAEFRKAFPDK